jgi:hypothetical protein
LLPKVQVLSYGARDTEQRSDEIGQTVLGVSLVGVEGQLNLLAIHRVLQGAIVGKARLKRETPNDGRLNALHGQAVDSGRHAAHAAFWLYDSANSRSITQLLMLCHGQYFTIKAD